MMTKSHLEYLLSQVTYKDWKFIVGTYSTRFYLQLEFGDQKSRKWIISPHMTKSEIIATALKAVITAEEHEVREAFKFKKQPIYSPHYDVEKLVALCEHNMFDKREV